MLASLLVFLRGMMMGAADIVPGVSGGTIAFVTGIYDRLIDAISGFPLAVIHFLKSKDLRSFVQESDLSFLITLLAGIVTSVFLFATLISYAISVHPIEVWSFFCGLILASIILIARQVSVWSFTKLVMLLCGGFSAWFLTESALLTLEHNLTGAFISGAIAICAMILPGISGSFLLLLLGTYAYVIGAIKTLDFAVLSVFAGGCLASLMLISRLISYLLRRYHNATLSFLLGLMIGSVHKIWPWKETISYRINSTGEQVPLTQANVWPHEYANLVGASPELFSASLSFFAGILLIVLVTVWIAKSELS